MYKVGDILTHKTIGVVVVTESLNSETSVNPRFGNKLFRFKRLVDDFDSHWLGHSGTLDKFVYATDDDIVQELLQVLSSFDLSEDVNMTVYHQNNMAVIATPFEDVVLTISELESLKALLNREL